MKPLIVIACFITISGLFYGCAKEDPDLALGETTFNNVCKVCHMQAINGAPILGNEKMWASRKDQSLDVLVEHATNGYGLMPAKGGREDLTEQEIRAAIKFMLSKLES